VTKAFWETLETTPWLFSISFQPQRVKNPPNAVLPPDTFSLYFSLGLHHWAWGETLQSEGHLPTTTSKDGGWDP
jgi:hypothetical protein